MRTIYIGGQKSISKGGIKWKVYMFLFVILAITGTVLKVAAPTIVEKWINENGSSSKGYAFSIRDVDLSLSKGQVILNDLKVFNSKTSIEVLETSNLTVQFDWADLIRSDDKKFSVSADKVEFFLSRDFASEMERIRALDNKKSDLYLSLVEGKIGRLNIIEQKDDQSRTVVELDDVNIKLKDFSLLSINKKSEFSVSSNVADGGKLKLSGKTSEANGETPWTIQGSLKQVPPDMLNKIAGIKLPFSFNESTLSAEITAQSKEGKVSGEISPEVTRLNLIEERPGIPTQTIARALTDELTFSLPFTLKDELTVQYADTFAKLKNYRKFAGASESQGTSSMAPVSQAPKAKKSGFWPF